MDLDIRVHVEDVNTALAQLVDRQMPFALSLAINTTTEEVRQAGRNQVRSQFSLRTPQSERFLSLGIAIKRKATKRDQFASLEVGGAMNYGKNLRYAKLAQFELGGTREGSAQIGDGRISVFNGVELIPLKKPMPRSLYPAMTGMQARRTIEGRMDGGGLKGGRRTFAVRTGPKQGLILQRTGKGKKSGVTPLFLIRPRVQLRARNWMLPVVDTVWEGRFNSNLDRALEYAIRTAK